MLEPSLESALASVHEVSTKIIDKAGQVRAPSNGTIKDFLYEFPTTILSKNYGRLLLTIWGSSPIIGIFLYFRKKKNESIAKKRAAEEEAKKKLEEAVMKANKSEVGTSNKTEAKKPPRLFLAQLKKLVTILIPSLFTKSGFFVLMYTVILCTRVLITIYISSLVGELGSLMGKRNFTKMFLLQAKFGLWCYPAALSNSLMKYFEKRISLQFRINLTQYLQKHYLNKRTFYKLKVHEKMENLDQRLTVEVEQFTSSLTYVYGHITKPALDVIFLTLACGKLMGFKLLGFFYLYFFGLNKLLSLIKPNFSRIVVESSRLESLYRADHQRISHYAEEIAFVGGEKREGAIVGESFNKQNTIVTDSLWSHFWTDLMDSYIMKYGGSMCAYSCIIPSVYVNWAGMTNQQAMGHYLTITSMLLTLGNALKDVILSYKEVSVLEGLTKRTFDLVTKIEEVSKSEDAAAKKTDSELEAIDGNLNGIVIRSPTIDYLEFVDCDIYTPDGLTQLVEKLSFKIKPGEHLLVSGMNGTGKSSLFRTMGDLWKLNKGVARLPPLSSLYFISQSAYMVPGTLRDQITYPKQLKNNSEDKKLLSLLAMVFSETSLKSFLERFNMDSVFTWSSLSGGEKQRIVIARLYYHAPKFGILDECTSAISIDAHHLIFTQAQELGITLITIAHDHSLRKHHKFELTFKGCGKWEMNEVNQSEI